MSWLKAKRSFAWVGGLGAFFSISSFVIGSYAKGQFVLV